MTTDGERVDEAIANALVHRRQFERGVFSWLLIVTVVLTFALILAVHASTHADHVGTAACTAEKDTIDYLRQRAKQLHHPGFALKDPDCGASQ